MAISIDNNPFNPGYGAPPPVLAGRDDLKNEVSRRLVKTGKGEKNPTAIALIGPRGCGKTALLGWIEEKAEKKKLPVLRLTKQHLQSVDEIQNFLIGQVDTKSWLDGLTLGGELKDPIGQLASLKGEYKWGSESTSGDKIRHLATLLAVTSAKGLALLIDEAHDMPPEVGRFFYDSAQSAAQRNPIMLVIAGTPDLESVLGRSGATV
ncbi:MAG: ATP-binding protein, partial [Rhodobacteraceae bacterium]|nr:ATP-binding protein [Paracoccaceae bacterium]